MAVTSEITIKSLQRQDGEKQIINQQTRGYLYQKKQATYLQYQEDSEGFEGVKTTLKIEKDRVTLIRHGKISMHQTFAEDVDVEGEYETGYGSIPMKIHTNHLQIARGLEEGRIKIEYDLFLGGEFCSQNTLEICYESIRSTEK